MLGILRKWYTVLSSTYAKAYPEQVAEDATHMDAEDRKMIPGIINEFGGLFYGTLDKLDKNLIDLELNPYYKSLMVDNTCLQQ